MHDYTSGPFATVDVPACDPVVCDPAAAPGGDCGCQPHAMPPGASACWYVWPDADHCPVVPPIRTPQGFTSVGSGYRLAIDRGIDATCNNPAPAEGVYAEVECEVCDTDPSANRYDCSEGCAGYWPRCCPLPTPGCFP